MYLYLLKKHIISIVIISCVILALYYYRNIYEPFSSGCGTATTCNSCHQLSNTQPNGHDCFWCKKNKKCINPSSRIIPYEYLNKNNCSMNC
jgi:hypothetical protein